MIKIESTNRVGERGERASGFATIGNPGSELRLGERERENKSEDNKWDGKKKRSEKKLTMPRAVYDEGRERSMVRMCLVL